jgi:NMD protein affecting ribosome stability and mRNA decay
MCGDCLKEFGSEEEVDDKDEIAVCRVCKDKVKLRVWNEWAKGE